MSRYGEHPVGFVREATGGEPPAAGVREVAGTRPQAVAHAGTEALR
ncbi:hypothetical protein ACFWVP_19115 [Streptomyces sp. NPDC058637]